MNLPVVVLPSLVRCSRTWGNCILWGRKRRSLASPCRDNYISNRPVITCLRWGSHLNSATESVPLLTILSIRWVMWSVLQVSISTLICGHMRPAFDAWVLCATTCKRDWCIADHGKVWPTIQIIGAYVFSVSQSILKGQLLSYVQIERPGRKAMPCAHKPWELRRRDWRVWTVRRVILLNWHCGTRRHSVLRYILLRAWFNKVRERPDITPHLCVRARSDVCPQTKWLENERAATATSSKLQIEAIGDSQRLSVSLWVWECWCAALKRMLKSTPVIWRPVLKLQLSVSQRAAKLH